MTNRCLAPPTPHVREFAHGLADKLAREQLASMTDIAGQCRKSGARYLPAEKAVIIDYLNRPYRLRLAGGEITGAAGEAVTLRDKILMLHYFIRAKGTPLSEKMITYQELPDGINYFPVFSKRAIEPIVNQFGREPEKLLEAAATLGGRQADYGDAAVTIDAFRRVPVTAVLWRGDAEFAPGGNLLFDRTIADYLANDDIHTLCENLAWRLAGHPKIGR